MSMRGKDFNTGLRGVLFEARHYERMGTAVWLYGWLVLRQTRQQDGVGWVLGGAAISYREIEEETGFNKRTLERWMQTLRRQGYIETESAAGGVSVRITKAKKFPRFPQGGRRIAEGGRETAEGSPQNCGATTVNPQPDQQLTGRIGSSCVERYKATEKHGEIHRHFHNPTKPCGYKNQNHKAPYYQNKQTQNQTANNHSGLDQTERHNFVPKQTVWEDQQREKYSDEQRQSEIDRQSFDRQISPRQFFAEARLRLRLLQAEREEAVRRELHVGTGPEVIRR